MLNQNSDFGLSLLLGSFVLIAIFLVSRIGAETLTLYPTDWTTISGITENGHEEARLLVHYDLSGIPDKAKILDASIYISCESTQDFLGDVCLYSARITSDWQSETADWNSTDGDNDWNEQGGDFDLAYGDYGCISLSSNAEQRLNVTCLIRDSAKNPTSFHGFIFFSLEYPQNSFDMEVFSDVVDNIRQRFEIKYSPPEVTSETIFPFNSRVSR